MQRFRSWLFLCIWVIATSLPAANPAEAALSRHLPAAQVEPVEPTPVPTRPATPIPAPDVKALLDRMTVADKIGQLFLVTLDGRNVAADSDIAILVRDYRVGGVVLLPANDNYRNVPVQLGPTGITPQVEVRNTPQQIAELANALQALALSPPQPIQPAASITGTAILTATATLTATELITPTATLPPTRGPRATRTLPAAQPTSIPEQPAAGIPLWVALDWSGDDSSFFAGTGGFPPLPSAMAVGATWAPGLAEQVGRVVGQELQTAGVNLLLGPTLDVLDVPRPGNQGDLGTRTFGGDPFWVGQMGQAFIRGVQAGGQGAVLTAAKHFPGQGGSDRRPEDEVPTVQRPLQQLRQIELAPFAAVTAGGDLQAPGITAALMTSHIRYRGLQASIREVTPPISLAPQLQDLMGLKEFVEWRAAGGLLISEALGVPALRRYYDPTLTKFPHRQVAQDAFLAGNDLLYLGQFALTDSWSEQIVAIKETVLFFQDKYRSDGTFRARVDTSVERIIRLKLGLYANNWQPTAWQRDVTQLAEPVDTGRTVTESVARAALTLIYPGRDELADRIPSAPLVNEKILIFTDTRAVRECATCDPVAVIAPNALQEIIQRLYGPSATGQVGSDQVHSLTFSDLARLLAAPIGAEREIEEAIADARWIIFAQLDDTTAAYPESAALQNFLARRSDSLRDKRLVVLGFSAPYYLDTTEISKLTAYFGVYGHTAPFLEAAVRALFREFTPVGAPPVSVAGISYELIRQLEPASGQIIPINPVGAADVITRSIQVGSQIELETGVILDRKGHPVPDGTLVEFHLRYPAESLALAPQVETTVGGKARTAIVLDRSGELWITAQAGEAKDSTRIEVKVGGDAPGSIATVVPTPTPEPRPTPTLTPPPTPTALPTPAPSPTPADSTSGGAATGSRPRVNLSSFLFGLLGAGAAAAAAFAVRRRATLAAPSAHMNTLPALTAALWAVAAGWITYLLYAVGWLPGATALQLNGSGWAAGAVTLAGGLVSLLWTARSHET